MVVSWERLKKRGEELGDSWLQAKFDLKDGWIWAENGRWTTSWLRASSIGCALTFASEAKFEIEAKILFRLEAKKKPDFTWFTSVRCETPKIKSENEGKISEN
jgi:hypothetical protein